MENKRYHDYEMFKYEFDKNQTNLEKREAIRDLKDYIKAEYERQLEEGNLDIEAERIRLEKELGVHYYLANDKNSYFRTLMIFTITTMITTGLFEMINKLPIRDVFKTSLIILIIMIIMLKIMQMDIDSKHYQKDFVNSISLKVLKEIEEDEK